MMMEVSDGAGEGAGVGEWGWCEAAVGGGSGVAGADAFPGSARAVAGGAAGVLAADPVGDDDAGGVRSCGCVVAGGFPLVPSCWRDVTGELGGALGPLPVVCREREEIALLRAKDYGVREIARRVGRDPGTISRELRRNAATRGGKREYRAVVAQWKAQQAAKRPKTAKLLAHDGLREYVQERLAGNVRRPDGTIVTGPQAPAWKGLNKSHRADRRW